MINNRCPICSNKKNTIIKEIKNFPVYQGCVTKKELQRFKFKFYIKKWKQCNNCTSLFLSSIPPLKYIYFRGHATGYGATWERHYKKFSDFILNQSKKNEKFIDVGGGTGILAKEILKKQKSVKLNILEPSPSDEIKKIKKIKIIKKNADYLYKNAHKYDSFIFSHSLEHINNLNSFLDGFIENANINSNIFISWPQQENWIKKSIPGTINFEHTFFINLANLIKLMQSKGLYFHKKQYFEKHSVFLYFSKINLKKNKLFFKNYSKKNFIDINEYYKKYEKIYLKDEIKKINLRKVYLMPASIYSQYIYYYLKDIISFTGVIDNSKSKQGKFLFGTNLKIYSKKILKNHKKTSIILSGGFHTSEIKTNILKFNNQLQIIDTEKLLNAKN